MRTFMFIENCPIDLKAIHTDNLADVAVEEVMEQVVKIMPW